MPRASRFQFRRLSAVVAGLFAVFLALQFMRPKLSTAPAADITAIEPVRQILRDSCYDCHSNQVRLKWFDRIVPAYWLVVADVNRGRAHLNFAGFDRLPIAQQRGILFEAVNQIQLGAMPPKNYTLLHPEARVTRDQLGILKEYLELSAPAAPLELTHDTGARTPFRAMPTNVRPAPNGITFEPDYRNWKAISTTDRFDNNSLRAVLANDVAFRAIDSHHTNPWPDGTMFAKVAWGQSLDAMGNVNAGKFIQVEFMIKDKKKYDSTKGWGFARWRGADLQPYGASPAFVEECVGCHTPMRDNDFVFTVPIQARQ